MDTTLPEQDPNYIAFDSLCLEHLKSTRKWTKFLSLIGFIFVGLMIIIAIGITSTQFSKNMSSVFAVLPMTLISLIYFFPIYFLWQFSAYSKAAIEHHDTVALATAMKYLKQHYTFMGILMIVMIVIYIFVGIAMVTMGGMYKLFG